MNPKIFCFSALAFVAFWLGPATVAAREEPGLRSYANWQSACAKLPPNRALQGRMPPRGLLPLSRYADFESALSLFLEQAVQGPYAQATNWVDGLPARGFFDTNRAYFLKGRAAGGIPFQPFAQKLTVEPGSQIFFRGDLHGDVHSLLKDLAWLNESKYLDGFSVQRTNFYMIFLGDYTDRGSYGIEVLYTLFRLKIANPERVFFARGNHEEVSLQSRYGFLQEGRAKYGAEFDPVKLFRAYDFIPAVIYAGSGDNFIQCNHGGMEPGYAPSRLIAADGPLRFDLIGKLSQKTFLQSHPDWLRGADEGSQDLARRAFQDFVPEDPIGPSVLGFMWNDFAVLASEPQFAIDPGRAFVYGAKATEYLLAHAGTDTRRVRAVFRAHQQSSALNPMMRRIIASGGIFRHWQTNDSPALLNKPSTDLAAKLETAPERSIPTGSVWTFNVAPDSVYGEGCNFSFDTFGLLTVARDFADWRLKRVNVPGAP